MVGGLPFVCVHLQQHAVSGNVTFIPGLVCVCRVTSVYFPSHILRLDLAVYHPQCSTWGGSRPTVKNTKTCMSAGWDGGLALALFTLLPQVSMALFGLFSRLRVSFRLFLHQNITNERFRWHVTLRNARKRAFRCHRVKMFAIFVFFFSVYTRYCAPSQKVSVT